MLRDNPILITRPLNTVQDFYRALGDICGNHRPTNLDALADVLRECRARRIVAAEWHINSTDTLKIARVLADLHVQFVR